MCHCGNKEDFKNCCGKYFSLSKADQIHAPTAEELMRSRYSAFVEKNYDYLKQTHDPQTFDLSTMQANINWAKSVKFTKLEIISTKEDPDHAVVEFIAHYVDRNSGYGHQHHEVSEVRKIKDRWVYTTGMMN